MLDAALLRAAFEVPVGAALRRPSPPDAAGHAAERRHVARAVPKRRAEFLTVRDCARTALAALGGPMGPLVPNPDRSPRWPAGFVGSLSHSSGLCAAVVARARDAASLGLDLELDGPLDEALHATVCTRAERRRLERLPRARAGLVAKRLFSAKEAFYKCQYPLTGTFLTCAQVELALDVEAGTFVAADIDLPPELERVARKVRGRCVTADDHVVATAWSPAVVPRPASLETKGATMGGSPRSGSLDHPGGGAGALPRDATGRPGPSAGHIRKLLLIDRPDATFRAA